MKKKVKLERWRSESMKDVNFHIGTVFLTVIELRAAIQEYIINTAKCMTNVPIF